MEVQTKKQDAEINNACTVKKIHATKISNVISIKVTEKEEKREKWKEVKNCWASLVAQWLRICLPMQGTQVRALVWEDPTCCGPTKTMHHNY